MSCNECEREKRRRELESLEKEHQPYKKSDFFTRPPKYLNGEQLEAMGFAKDMGNKCKPNYKVASDMVDAEMGLFVNKNNNTLDFMSSWGYSRVDISPLVKNSETCTRLSLKTNEDDCNRKTNEPVVGWLQYTSECGCDIIRLSDIAKFINIADLKVFGEGDGYVYKKADGGIESRKPILDGQLASEDSVLVENADGVLKRKLVSESLGKISTLEERNNHLTEKVRQLEELNADDDGNIASNREKITALETALNNLKGTVPRAYDDTALNNAIAELKNKLNEIPQYKVIFNGIKKIPCDWDKTWSNEKNGEVIKFNVENPTQYDEIEFICKNETEFYSFKVLPQRVGDDYWISQTDIINAREKDGEHKAFQGMLLFDHRIVVEADGVNIRIGGYRYVGSAFRTAGNNGGAIEEWGWYPNSGEGGIEASDPNSKVMVMKGESLFKFYNRFWDANAEYMTPTVVKVIGIKHSR